MAIKEEVVEDVLLTKLREIARRESVLLFRKAKLNPNVQMPNVAVLISQAINRAPIHSCAFWKKVKPYSRRYPKAFNC